jgi:uncharacterized membrane protein YbhN (UPF0104 family)
LRCVLSASLIAFVLRKVSWHELGAIIHQAKAGWILSASALTGLLVIGLAIRWRLFLRDKGIELPFGIIFVLSWAGQFFNAVLPGSTGGDVVKIYQACRLNPDEKAAAAATVLADRLTGLVALLLLAGIGLVINPLPLRILSHETLLPARTIYLLSIGCGFVVVAAWFVFRRARGTLWGGRLRRTLSAAKGSFTFDWRLLAAFCVSLAMHLVTILIPYLFAKALGLSLTGRQALLIVPVVALFVMLPLTINGHGLRELLLIAYFTEMGVTAAGMPLAAVRDTAVAFSLLMVTNDLLWALPGGLLYLARFKSTRQRDRPA